MYKTLLLAVPLAALLATSAFGSTIVFDNQSAHPGGTLTFGTTSGNASLVGGVIDQVTSINGGTTSFAVTGNCGAGSQYGCLSFTTGAFLDSSSTSSTITYRYAAGGALTIVGVADGGSGMLFTNLGFDAPVTLVYNTATGLASLSGSILSGTLNAALASSLHVLPTTLGGTDTSSAFNVTFSGVTGSGSATTNSVQLAATTTTPEPGSLVLIGSGLIGLAMISRRRHQS